MSEQGLDKYDAATLALVAAGGAGLGVAGGKLLAYRLRKQLRKMPKKKAQRIRMAIAGGVPLGGSLTAAGLLQHAKQRAYDRAAQAKKGR